MSLGAELTIEGGGPRPVVLKSARHPAARSRLEHELAMLRAAQHPGVVTVAGVDDDGDVLRVRTAFCGSRSLANTPMLPVPRVAGMIAALATTVADLHDLGIAHGRIAPDHVLVAADGRPVLCGFGDASLGETAGSRRPDDVAALGMLLRTMLDRHDDVSPIPPARLARRSAWNGYQRRALLNLADQATADDPALRPTARQLARNVRATVPDATLLDPDSGGAPDDEVGDSPRSNRSGGRRLPVVVGAGLAFIGVVAMATGLLASDGPARPIDHGVGAEAAPSAGSAADGADLAAAGSTMPPPSLAPTTIALPPPGVRSEAMGCAADTLGSAGVATRSDGRPCPVDVSFHDGVLSLSDETYHLGLADAAVAIGAFECDGSPQLAVLDRATGDVFVFERWAGDDDPVHATVREKVEGGSRLVAEPADGGRCHRLVVLDQYGIRHVTNRETRR